MRSNAQVSIIAAPSSSDRIIYINRQRMKKIYRFSIQTAIFLCITAASAAVAPPGRVARPVDPFRVAELFRPDSTCLATTADAGVPVVRHMKRTAEPNTTTYTGAFQTFHTDSGKQFVYSGGEFLSYKVDIAINGTEATVSNLFNLEKGYPFDNSIDYPVTGTYNASTRTITIPSPREIDKSTKVGLVYGQYTASLMCGHVDSDGTMTPDDKMVLKINEDGSVSSTQNFGAMLYDYSGSPIGFKVVYKGALLSDDLSKPHMAVFTSRLDFGRCYPGDSRDRTFRMFNLSDSSIETSFSTTGAFAAFKPSISVPSMKERQVDITFTAESLGENTGEIVISDKSGSSKISLRGSVVEMADYSYLIDSGRVDFYTDADFPFEVYEKDGGKYARSNIPYAQTGDCSFFEVIVEVDKDQIGTLSWEGESSSEMMVSSSTVTVDGAVFKDCSSIMNADISGTVKFTEGRHVVRFDYTVLWDTYFSDVNFMYLGKIRFSQAPIKESAGELLTPRLVFPNSLLEKGGIAEKTVQIAIRNEGTSPLTLTGVVPSEHFSPVMTEGNSVSTLEELLTDINFSAVAAGQYDEEITLKTTAGDFVVKCSALVRDMPDFQTIVKKGDFQFVTDEQNPFLLSDGKAYNSTSKVLDDEVRTCNLKATFNVPDGYFGRLSWKGRLSCADANSQGWTDFLNIGIQTQQKTTYTIAYGEYDLDTANFPYFDAPDVTNLMCTPGECAILFSFYQCGDNKYGGEVLVEIYDLSIELIEDDNTAVLINEELDFGELYEGKSKMMYVSMLNLGTEPLEIIDFECDGDFRVAIPSTTAPYNQYINIPIYFEPESAGHHEAEMIIGTTSGDFFIKVSGEAMSTEGIVLLEDFEDDAANWMVYDRDGDGDGWNLAFNVYGGYPQSHVHGGEECIVSFSGDYFNNEWRTFRPDNWTLSPSFIVPDNGAWLTWYAAGDYEERLGDVYSVYVCEGVYTGFGFDFDNYKEVATEQLNDTEWHYHCVDLSEYASKEVHVAFRHHDSEGIYMVKIDDVIVYDHNPLGGVEKLDDGMNVIRMEYYSLDGRRLSAPAEHGSLS